MASRKSLRRWFADRSLTTKVLLPTLLVLTVAAGGIIWYMSSATRRNTIDETVITAKSTIEQYKALRTYYTANVVAKVKKHTDLEVSFNHKQQDAAIPLPATVIHDLSEEFSKSASGMKMRLYSAYPFPNRRQRQLDQFDKDALKHLNEHPDETFVRVEPVDGVETTRVAIADRMSAQSCVDCHNSRADSPKTDWKLGDVRGVLQVSLPVKRQLANNAQVICNTSYIIVGSAVAAILLLGFVLRVVGGRLKNTVCMMEAVANGDLSQQLDDESRDEVGRMSAAVNQAVVALRDAKEQERVRAEHEKQLAAEQVERQRQEVLREEQRAAQLKSRVNELLTVVTQVEAGDLTQQIPIAGNDSVARLAEGLNSLFNKFRVSMSILARNARTLADSSIDLSAVSHQMSATAEETSAQANVVSAASEQVSNNVQTVATGVEEMSASIREIAGNAQEAARVAQQAVQVADTTNRSIGKLGDSSTEIGKVVKVITSIAEQTNLLALNATIEAARAGEAGKGFAVVANEVKELAKETAKATEDISKKIGAIQTDTHGAVDAIQRISQIIGQVNEISNTIATAVGEQALTTNEIARNVAEASKGSGEIAQNITTVATAAQGTTQGASNTQQSASELARMAAELQQLVSQFKYEADCQQTAA